MSFSKRDLLQLATQLGIRVTAAHTPSSIKTLVDQQIHEIYGRKGIGANTTVEYDSRAPRSVAGRRVTLQSGSVTWDGFYPQVRSVEGHTYGAHTVALHATVVK